MDDGPSAGGEGGNVVLTRGPVSIGPQA